MADPKKTDKPAAAKRGRKPVPENENDGQRFSRLATARTRKLLAQIESLGKLSGRGYEYSDAQVEKIFNNIDNALSAARSKFERGEKAAKTTFSL